MQYGFTGKTKTNCGVLLQQIYDPATRIAGGWIETEDNLSQDGDAWIFPEACVSGEARVYGDAWICDQARVWGRAHVHGAARISGYVVVCDSATVYGNAQVAGSIHVGGETRIYGMIWLFGESILERTEDVVAITGVGRNLTITRDMVSVGCIPFTTREWRSLTTNDARMLGTTTAELRDLQYLVSAVRERFLGRKKGRCRSEGKTLAGTE